MKASNLTPLSWAVEKGHEAVAQLLFDRGAEVNENDNDGRLVWRQAASCVHIDSLKDIIPSTEPNLEAIEAIAREKGRKWAIDSKNEYFTGENYHNAVLHNSVLDLVYDEHLRPSQCGGKRHAVFMIRPHAELSPAEYWLQMNMNGAHARAAVLRTMGLSQRIYLLMVPMIAIVGDLILALAGG